MFRPTDADPATEANGNGRRRSSALFRWLHIYVSMASFGILLFFAVTGLTLNHADWFFSEHSATSQAKGSVDVAWVRTGGAPEIARLEIVEHLRHRHGVKGAVGEFRVEPAECTVVFKGPGYSAEARIDRQTGTYELNETRLGFVAVINDLHKGRDSGPGWSLVVDLSALLMVVVSVTGLALIVFLKRRFVTGLLTACGGALLSVAAYIWLVP